MKKHIEKFGYVCEQIWEIKGLSTQIKRGLIEQVWIDMLEELNETKRG